MKHAALIVASLALTPGMAATAATQNADWMPMDQVVRKLGEAGYTDIRKLEAEGGRWEGQASKDGGKVSFEVDPRSGVVSERTKDAKGNGRDAEEDDD